MTGKRKAPIITIITGAGMHLEVVLFAGVLFYSVSMCFVHVRRLVSHDSAWLQKLHKELQIGLNGLCLCIQKLLPGDI